MCVWPEFIIYEYFFIFKVLSEILDSMTNITFKTTWSEAQQMLIDNPTFAEDTDLLSEYSN